MHYIPCETTFGIYLPFNENSKLNVRKLFNELSVDQKVSRRILSIVREQQLQYNDGDIIENFQAYNDANLQSYSKVTYHR